MRCHLSPGVVVLAPPWPRSGSSNIFAAQTAAYARQGARVLLLLTPLGRTHSPSKTSVWNDAVAAMKFPGVEAVAYPRGGRNKTHIYLQWLLAGRDDSLAIMGRYGASGRMPAELDSFLASARVDLIHANHVFSMPLARRVAGLVHRMQGVRPRILLDTHDIQSDMFAGQGRKNPMSERADAHDALLRTELALCAQADTLIHVAQADFDFFSNCLPKKRHELILPTLHPESEVELVRRRGQHRPAKFDFVYVGNNHDANLETVRWLLREVLLFASPALRERICIIGTVGDLLSRRDPTLYRRHEHLFGGEMSSLFDIYTAAKAVLAPAVAGTGSSIKLIEALCAGKPIVATSLALRGLPRPELTGADLHVHDTAADFADALTRLSERPHSVPAHSSGNAALYDRLFSNTRYFTALDTVVSDPPGLTPLRDHPLSDSVRHSRQGRARVSDPEGPEGLTPPTAQNLRIKPTSRPWMSTWSGPKMRVS
jgi:glycosyltransferase involved in cell wall biosynthesis